LPLLNRALFTLTLFTCLTTCGDGGMELLLCDQDPLQLGLFGPDPGYRLLDARKAFVVVAYGHDGASGHIYNLPRVR
jgi:hypothetical protein